MVLAVLPLCVQEQRRALVVVIIVSRRVSHTRVETLAFKVDRVLIPDPLILEGHRVEGIEDRYTIDEHTDRPEWRLGLRAQLLCWVARDPIDTRLITWHAGVATKWPDGVIRNTCSAHEDMQRCR